MIKFRFWKSDKHGLIRVIDDEFPQVSKNRIWVHGSPYVLDAITGMGEDAYSCGEWAEEIEPSEAIDLALGKGIDLFDIPDAGPEKQLEASAIKMALLAHGKQRYGDKPYQLHLEQVQAVLIRFGLDSEKNLVIAAWLHDTLEDTALTAKEIADQFGSPIADIVYRVTDEVGANRQERKSKTYPKIRNHREATLVKLCDRIANVEASSKDPEKRLMYQNEYFSFKKGVWVDGIADPLWTYLDSVFFDSQ